MSSAPWSCHSRAGRSIARVAVARDIARALDGIGQDKIPRQAAFLEQRQERKQSCRFSARWQRAHVGVADEQMQPPVFAVIGERFVARVDDRAVELHPLVDVVDDVIGALAELEIDRPVRLRRLEIERERIGLADAAGAGEDLPRGEKAKQRAEHVRRELRLPLHQVILMAAERRAGVVIDVVFDERDVTRLHPSASSASWSSGSPAKS